jgi:hypothetical protein
MDVEKTRGSNGKNKKFQQLYFITYSMELSLYHLLHGAKSLSLTPWSEVFITYSMELSLYHLLQGAKPLSLTPWSEVFITYSMELSLS